jgi:hypothetical protein
VDEHAIRVNESFAFLTLSVNNYFQFISSFHWIVLLKINPDLIISSIFVVQTFTRSCHLQLPLLNCSSSIRFVKFKKKNIYVVIFSCYIGNSTNYDIYFMQNKIHFRSNCFVLCFFLSLFIYLFE